MKNKLLIAGIVAVLFFGSVGFAVAAPSGTFQRSLWPETTNTYDLGSLTKLWNHLYVQFASTTALSATTICLSADCKTAWPTSGSGSGTIGTSSPLTSGQPLYATGVNTIASVASSTFLTSIGGQPAGSYLTSAITTLGDIFHTGLTGATQTFSTSTADTNLGMRIVSSGTTHLFTPYWIGTLADARIASAATWNAKQSALGSLTGIIMGNAGSFYGTATSSPIAMSITGNAGTVTNGVYTTGAGTVYQAPITLTTTGTSGAATFVANTLNIPNYATGSTFAYPFPNNATSSVLTFSDAPILSNIATPAGYFLATDPTGKIISTTTPTGGSGISTSLTKGWTLVGNDAGIAQATSSIFIDSQGKVGIGNTAPQTDFVLGPGFASAINGRPVAYITDNYDGISGVDMGNTSASASADFRFQIRDGGNHYIAFMQPSPANTGTLLGNTRGESDFILTNGGTARNLIIGNVTAKDIIFGTNNAENMRIASGGKVGIGTTTPTGKLQLASTANTRLTITDTNATSGGKHWFMNSDSGDFSIGTTSDTLATSKTHLSITGSLGNVGIGTSTDATKKLSVEGQIYPTEGIYFNDGTTQTTAATAGGSTVTSGFASSTGTRVMISVDVVSGDVIDYGGYTQKGATSCAGSSGIQLDLGIKHLTWAATTTTAQGFAMASTKCNASARERFVATTTETIRIGNDSSSSPISDPNYINVWYQKIH